jgi:hypothetical protein
MVSRAFLATLGIVAITACSDSTGPSSGVSLGRMAGTWDLSRLDMVLLSDSTVSQDLKAAFGISATLTIQRTGSAVLVLRQPGQPDATVSATVSLRGDTLAYVADSSGYEAIVRLSGRTMTWRALLTTYWDLDGDGSAEEVFERDVWQRR